MSRRTSFAAVVALVAVCAVPAHAQVGFGLAAGVSAPMGDFADAAKSGYHVTGIATLSIPLAPVGGRFEGSFNEFDNKGTGATGKSRIVSGTANVVLSTPGFLGPYLIGGIGLYHASSSCAGCSSSTKTGFNGGGGFKIGLAGFAVFGEARFHYIPVSGGSTQYIPVSVGVTF